jgi:hypothetical protein
VLLLAALGGGTPAARGDGEPAADPPAPLLVDREATPPAPAVVAPRAAVAVEGRPAPGLMVTLRGEGSTGGALAFRWQQVGGPPVALDDPHASTTRFIAPASGGTLAFLLAVANAEGVDTAIAAVPLEGPAAGASLHADAGDDQVAVVGRQVTLNGVRSEPRDRIGFRWIQIAGPRVELKLEQGTILTFVPPAPGAYRFALVVAAGGEISQPDEVEVIAAMLGASPEGAAPPPAPAAPAAPTLGQFARQALVAIPGGRPAARELAGCFEEVAGRVGLYETYDELYSELARRLEGVVPAEPGRRQPWLDRLFGPLTTHLVATMRPLGLELATPEGRAAPLTDDQRDRLAGQFRELAAGFRSLTPGRVGADAGAGGPSRP